MFSDDLIQVWESKTTQRMGELVFDLDDLCTRFQILPWGHMFFFDLDFLSTCNGLSTTFSGKNNM